MGNPLLYFRNKSQSDDRKRKAADLLLSLVERTNLDEGSINNIVRGYVENGDVQLPGAPQADAKTNTLRPRIITRNEETGAYDWAPEGVSDRNQLVEVGRRFAPPKTTEVGKLYAYDENGVLREVPGASARDKVVGRPPTRPGDARGRGGITPIERADLATIAKYQQAEKEAAARGTPISEELLNQAIEAAERLNMPTHDVVEQSDEPGLGGKISRMLPGGKSGKELVRRRGLGKKPSEAPLEFASEQEAEDAGLPPGTRVIISRWAVIE